MTPGHGYLEALAADNVTVRSDPIRRFTAEGIEMKDGTVLAFDAIICATGFDTSYRPSFPVIGSDGNDLREIWKEDPRSYLSVAVNGFPNYFSLCRSVCIKGMEVDFDCSDYRSEFSTCEWFTDRMPGKEHLLYF
jgi:cation diffusion facilitator CzcD-associated flavoprotein CzcO